MNGAPGFLDEDDFSLAADLVRAAIEVGGNAGEHGIYLPEERARYRALAIRLYDHGLVALKADSRTSSTGIRPPTGRPVVRHPATLRHPIHAWAVRVWRTIRRSTLDSETNKENGESISGTGVGGPVK